MKYPIYQGKVSLIKLRKKHFPLFYRWWNDAALRKLTSESKEVMTREKINEILMRHLQNTSYFDFIIVANKKPIGHVLVQYKKRKKHFELYIAIGEKNYWGRGIGAVAIRRTARWFIRHFPQEKALYLEVLANNQHAIDCYDFVGFTRVRLIPKSKTILMKFLR